MIQMTISGDGMVASIKGKSRMNNMLMEKEFLNTKMEIYIQATFIMETDTAQECLSTLMGIYMKVNGKMIGSMAMGNSFSKLLRF